MEADGGTARMRCRRRQPPQERIENGGTDVGIREHGKSVEKEGTDLEVQEDGEIVEKENTDVQAHESGEEQTSVTGEDAPPLALDLSSAVGEEINLTAGPVPETHVDSSPESAPIIEERGPTDSPVGALEPSYKDEAGSRADKLEPDDDGEEEITEISADSIAAAVAASTAVETPEPQTLPVAKESETTTQSDLFDMPPPPFLPRQLRMKRKSAAKSVNPYSSRAHTQTASDACALSSASGDDHVGQTGSGQSLERRTEAAGAPAASAASPLSAGSDQGKVDDEFVLFMKEIHQLDSQLKAVKEETPQPLTTQPQPETATARGPSSEPQLSHPQKTGAQVQQQEEPMWRTVVDAASGKTYYWNVVTDEVTWDAPKGVDVEKPLTDAAEKQQHDLLLWAASTFKLTQELPTCGEKVQQLILQLDFIEEELDEAFESSALLVPDSTSEEISKDNRLERFRSLKRRREQQGKPAQEAKTSGSDDELLQELIDLQLQQEQQPGAIQCARCKQRTIEMRGSQTQQAKIRHLASALARRLGSVEKEWAAAMLAALKARLDDWIDGGLGGSFFLQRLGKMHQDFQKHQSQDEEAESRKQDLASVFPYSAAAAASSNKDPRKQTKPSPRNCLATAVTAATAAATKAAAKSTASAIPAAACASTGSRSAGTEPRSTDRSSKRVSGDSLKSASSPPPTPLGPPPTLPDHAPQAAAEVAQVTGAAAAATGCPRHKGSLESHPAASPVHGASGAIGKRATGSGPKRLISSNPLVRKRMQLVEKWQKNRENEESEEEDYEQRKERLKQKKLDEWREREMASHKGMKNANFIEVSADWRTLVEKK